MLSVIMKKKVSIIGIIFSVTSWTPIGASSAIPQERNHIDLPRTEQLPIMNQDSKPIVASADATLTVETPELIVTINPPPPPPPPVRTARARTASASTVSSNRSYSDVAPSGSGSSIVDIAMQYVGVPYVSGGSSPDGFDCSGFTQYVFAQAGISLSRSSSGQRSNGTVVSDPAPGDLIYSPGHIAIYVGNGNMIDSPRPGKTVQVRAMWQTSPVFIRVA